MFRLARREFFFEAGVDSSVLDCSKKSEAKPPNGITQRFLKAISKNCFDGDMGGRPEKLRRALYLPGAARLTAIRLTAIQLAATRLTAIRLAATRLAAIRLAATCLGVASLTAIHLASVCLAAARVRSVFHSRLSGLGAKNRRRTSL